MPSASPRTVAHNVGLLVSNEGPLARPTGPALARVRVFTTSGDDCQSANFRQPNSANFRQPNSANFRQPNSANFRQPNSANFRQPNSANFRQPNSANFRQPN